MTIVSNLQTNKIEDLNEAAKRRVKIWREITKEAALASQSQSVMSSFFHSNILKHGSFENSISFFLADLLGSNTIPSMTVQSVFKQAFIDQPDLVDRMLDDLMANYTRDAACDYHYIPLLYYKGFHAIQAYRISHWLWTQKREMLALYFQNRITELFDVDIHPAASLGSGIMLDHATGLVVGETTVIEDDVSIMHNVTLGGCGTSRQDRHPKVRRGVLISSGAKILGNIEIGIGAKVGAGSVVLNDVEAYTTVAGVPGKQVGRSSSTMPSLEMDHNIDA